MISPAERVKQWRMANRDRHNAYQRAYKQRKTAEKRELDRQKRWTPCGESESGGVGKP